MDRPKQENRLIARFSPGQSGNPQGRPKGSRDATTTSSPAPVTPKALTMALISRLNAFTPDGITYAASLAADVVERARRNPAYLALVLDRTEGRLATLEQASLTVDNSRHVTVALLADTRLRELAIELQRSLALQAGVVVEAPLVVEQQPLEAQVVQSVGQSTQKATGGLPSPSQLEDVVTVEPETEAAPDPDTGADGPDPDGAWRFNGTGAEGQHITDEQLAMLRRGVKAKS